MFNFIAMVAAILYSFGIAQVFMSWVVLSISGFFAVAIYIGLPFLIQDEEAFTGLMEKLAKNNGFSVFIGVMTNVLLLSVVWIAFSPILSMAILPSTIIALGMYFIARSKAA